jgi:hypothetical protein
LGSGFKLVNCIAGQKVEEEIKPVDRVMLYPNPLKGPQFNIQLPKQSTGNVLVTIINSNVVVNKQKLTPKGYLIKVSLDKSFASGTYLVNIVSGGRKYTSRLINIK